ncbi:MAG TPA: glycosyltransferase family 2 protein [Candidatus Saccharimonadales bacterium]|nr:glycosyltransferase family 2 protein [Candidatus Saccharimonadales bacterium]
MSSSAAGRPLPFVSVVLPMRNEAGHLRETLGAVFAQDYPADRMEIVVAEGGSSDGTRESLEALASARGGMTVVDNPGRIAPTGLNAAIRASRGEIIVRVDGHTVVEPDYVTRAVEALGRTGADVVGGNMTPIGQGLFGRSVALATCTPMGVGGSRFHYAGAEEEAESVYMGVFRRDVFSRFGWFDERLVRNQDDELNYRIREGGGKIVLVPALRSVYAPRESPAKLFRQYFQYGLYKVRVASLHPRQARPRHLIPSAFVVALLALLGAAPFSAAAFLLLIGLVAAHALASLAFAFGAGRREPAAWLLVPLVTMILHAAYGTGFLAGCGAAAMGRTPGARPGKEGLSA